MVQSLALCNSVVQLKDYCGRPKGLMVVRESVERHAIIIQP